MCFLKRLEVIFLTAVLLVFVDSFLKEYISVFYPEYLYINYSFLNPFLALIVFFIFCVLVLWQNERLFFDNKLFLGSFLLVVIGFLSNLYDKIYYGGVIDYIYFNIVSLVLNLSDIYIITGFLFMLRILTKESR